MWYTECTLYKSRKEIIMFKKSLFMLVALAIAATTVMIPMASSAADISGDLYFNVDFQDGSLEEKTGNFSFLSGSSCETEGEDAEFFIEDDSTLNRKVGVFTGWGPLVYSGPESLNGYDLTGGITLEAYVNLNELDHDVVFMETAGSSLHLQQYNSGEDQSVGLRCGDATAAGEGGDSADPGYKMRNAYKDGVLDNGRWVHILGTSNGQVNQFYIDGELVATVDRVSSALRTVNNNTNADLYIGESYFGSMFGPNAFEGKMAFVKMYKAYADEDTAKALYTAATGGTTDDPTDDTSTPTVTPTDDATDTPTNTPTDNATNKPTNTPTDNATNKPTNTPNNGGSNGGGQTSNTQTFDLGIVSLAAVALSSAVAIKKRK